MSGSDHRKSFLTSSTEAVGPPDARIPLLSSPIVDVDGELPGLGAARPVSSGSVENLSRRTPSTTRVPNPSSYCRLFELDENVNNVCNCLAVPADAEPGSAPSTSVPAAATATTMTAPGRPRRFTVINYGRNDVISSTDDDDNERDDALVTSRPTLTSGNAASSSRASAVPGCGRQNSISAHQPSHLPRQSSAERPLHSLSIARHGRLSSTSTAELPEDYRCIPSIHETSGDQFSTSPLSRQSSNVVVPNVGRYRQSSATVSGPRPTPQNGSCGRGRPSNHVGGPFGSSPGAVVIDIPSEAMETSSPVIFNVGSTETCQQQPGDVPLSTSQADLGGDLQRLSNSRASTSSKASFWNRRSLINGDYLRSLKKRKSSTVSDPQSPSIDETADGGAAASAAGSDSYREVVDRSRLPDVAKRGRLFAKRFRRRLVLQSGVCNVSYANVDRRGARFLLDIFTTMLEMKWSYNILVYLSTFFIGWVVFALLWWAVQAVRSDICVMNVNSFMTALLFSIETQHTIGYGYRYVTDSCPEAVLLVMVQSVFGAVTQCIVTGIIFAKMARPNRRSETVIFSRKAVINRDRDGTLCLSFRVGDVRSSQLMGVSLNALLVRKVTGPSIGKKHGSGHVNLNQERLMISTEMGDDFFFLAWPIKVIHRIDESSPLWEMSPEQLLMASFEILVILEACCEATGSSTQVRMSYLPSEILWGHELAPLLTYQKDNGRYKVDFAQFHNVHPADTPEMSAKDIALLDCDCSAPPNSDTRSLCSVRVVIQDDK